MTDPTAPAGSAASAPAEAQADEQAIRERVRDLTAQMLSGGRLDSEGVKEVVRAMGGGAAQAPLDGAQAREAFARRSAASTRRCSARRRRPTRRCGAGGARQGVLRQRPEERVRGPAEAAAGLRCRRQPHRRCHHRQHPRVNSSTSRCMRSGSAPTPSVRIAQVMSEFANRIGGTTRAACRARDCTRCASTAPT